MSETTIGGDARSCGAYMNSINLTDEQRCGLSVFGCRELRCYSCSLTRHPAAVSLPLATIQPRNTQPKWIYRVERWIDRVHVRVARNSPLGSFAPVIVATFGLLVVLAIMPYLYARQLWHGKAPSVRP